MELRGRRKAAWRPRVMVLASAAVPGPALNPTLLALLDIWSADLVER